MGIKMTLPKKSGPAVAALSLMATAACGQESTSDEKPVNEPGAGEYVEEAASATGDALEDVGAAIVQGLEETTEAVGEMVDKEVSELNALGLTIRNILGEEVRTRGGVVAARMDDLLFTADGEPALAVLSEGGMFGVGDDRVIVAIQRLLIKQDSLGEVSVEITITDEELETLGDGVSFMPTDFSVAGRIDTSLLSARKLLETAIYNVDDQKVADTYDLVLGPEWKIDNIVVSTGGIADVGDRLVAADWTMFSLTDDNAALRTSVAMRDFDDLPLFVYEDLVVK